MIKEIREKIEVRSEMSKAFVGFIWLSVTCYFAVYLHIEKWILLKNIIILLWFLFFCGVSHLLVTIINHNYISEEIFEEKLKLAKRIKIFLEEENYYWMIKRFMIFDIDHH